MTPRALVIRIAEAVPTRGFLLGCAGPELAGIADAELEGLAGGAVTIRRRDGDERQTLVEAVQIKRSPAGTRMVFLLVPDGDRADASGTVEWPATDPGADRGSPAA